MKNVKIICLTVILMSMCILPFPISAINKGVSIEYEYGEVDGAGDRPDLDTSRSSKRWAIIIGINDYDDQYIHDLEKSRNDAKGLNDVLLNEGRFDHVFTFTDDKAREDATYATLNNVIGKMEYLRHHIRPDDTLVFSFSGHGVADEAGKSYLLMTDSLIASPYLTGLPVSAVTEWIEDLGVKRNILLLDACRNNPGKIKGAVDVKKIITANDEPAEVSAILYATSPGKYSHEHLSEPYSVFTVYLLDGLKGKADANYDLMITFNELRQYVEQKVYDWSLEYNKFQKPYTRINGEFYGDVILSVVPLQERVAYNPDSIRESYAKRLQSFKVMNGVSLAASLTGFTGGAVGAVMFGTGHFNYMASTNGDFDLYYDMRYSGFISMVTLTGIGLAALIPFIISYVIKPKIQKAPPMIAGIGYGNETLVLSLNLKLKARDKRRS